MKRTIWKFPLAIADTQVVAMRSGAKVLAVQAQGDALCLWAIVDPDAPDEAVEFRIHGTGHPLPNDAHRYEHVGTVQQGAFVWHVFRFMTLIETLGRSFA